MVSRLLSTLHSKMPWLDRVGVGAMTMGRAVVLTSLTLTALVLGLRYLGVLQGMELAAYDYLIRIQPDEGEDDRLLIVGITEDDLQRLQEWPISDRTIAQVLEKLATQHPQAIGLDIVRDIPVQPGRDELLNQLQSSDRIIAVCKASAADDPGIPPPPGVDPNTVGFADLVVDPGGTLRRSLLLLTPPSTNSAIAHQCNDPNTTLTAFSFQLALSYLEAKGVEVQLTDGELYLGSIRLPRLQSHSGSYQIADASGYQIMLRYRSGDRVARQVSLMDVLENRVPPAWIQNRLVLIGYTTPQAKDEFYTPYSAGEQDSQKMPGVVVHAQAVSQLLSTVLEGRPLIWYWSGATEALWILGWSLVGGVAAWYIRRPLKFGVMIIAILGVVYGIGFLVFLQGGWIPLIPAAIALLITASGVVLIDRFNKSDYGKTVYRQVKSLLKIDIEIDEEKLQKQVAEITETDYFQDLHKTVKSLRDRHENGNENENAVEQNPKPTLSEPKSNISELNGASKIRTKDNNDFEIDYLNQLRQDAKRLKTSSPEERTDSDSDPLI